MKIKNIAIIAHVDHGKTTLVDGALRQSGVFRKNQVVADRVMDSNDLEREKGITIFSKNASMQYKDYRINIVDTPGHADFGGEVQRIMKMVDSVLLLVDAFEGPMPQTKYVLKKSLEIGLNPIVVINKIDRPNARPKEVLEMVFDLFVDLNANDEQLDFPVVYASGRDAYAQYEPEDESDNLIPLFDTILKHVPDARGDKEKPLQMLVSAIEYNDYLGKLGTGKISNGRIRQGDEVVLMKRDGERLLYRISKIFQYEGLSKKETGEAFAGDIVSVAGMERVDVGETVGCKDHPEPLPLIDIDAPTLSMTFRVNDSPFAGKDGKYVTSRNIRDRLHKEIQTNVSIIVEDTEKSDEFIVKGMNFSIKPSSKIALVGPSGCGKTTLLALILRLYEPKEGAILIDDLDIRDMKLKSLKTQIGIALQEPFLWNDTVANNILYGAEGAGREDLVKAAEIAEAHNFVSNLPKQYDSIIGEAACRISEGQKQRIAIARAVIGRPKILMLDEAMCSLDSETEDKIVDNIRREFENSTIIIVSHRLSTVRKMDCVYFLEGPGRMNIGTHDSLLTQNQKYRDLFASQIEKQVTVHGSPFSVHS